MALIVAAGICKNGEVQSSIGDDGAPHITNDLMTAFKMPGAGDKATCDMPGNYSEYSFSVYVDPQSNGFQYACIFRKGDVSKLRVVYSFLGDIKDKYSLGSPDIKADLKDSLAYWNRPDADKFSRVQDKLDKLKDTMKDNINMVLIRGDKLEQVLQQSEDLVDSASTFNNQAKQAHCMMFKRHWKWNLMIAFAVLSFIGIIVLLTQV